MTQKLIAIFLFCVVSFTGQAQQAERDSIKLFYLGGQSNMVGLGYNKDLPDSLNIEFENVWIFHGKPAPDENNNGGKGEWDKLKPGHGQRFKVVDSKNVLSNRFGPELSFAKEMQKRFPNEKIAIIKYSKGGTSIDSLAAANFGAWDPDYVGKTGINQFDHFQQALKNAFAQKDIDGDGREDVLIPSGIIWMQGESDSNKTIEIAEEYYDNLTRLMHLIRGHFRDDKLPIVIGKISESNRNDAGKVWTYGELVQHAQEEFVRHDKNAAIVRSTKKYKYSDPWHYDSFGYIDLGYEFAKALFKLLQEEK